ncbi:hypothetical protein J3F84DRAFT_228567 [Trichoderma pleuroticola]
MSYIAYPQDVDLAAGAVREPLANVTKAVENPLLLSLAQPGRDDVQNKGGPTTDTGHSQTTNTTGASGSGSGGTTGANSGARNDLSRLDAQAPRPGPASTHHTTGAVDGRSVSGVGTSDSKTGDSAYGTANDPYVDHEVSHMAPWAQDKIRSLGKEK